MDDLGNVVGGTEGEDAEAEAPSKLMQGINKWTGYNAIKDTQLFDFSKYDKEDEVDDEHIRFTIGGAGRRLTKDDFLSEMRSLDPKGRAAVIEKSSAPPALKDLARQDADASIPGSTRIFSAKDAQPSSSSRAAKTVGAMMASARGGSVGGDADDSQAHKRAQALTAVAQGSDGAAAAGPATRVTPASKTEFPSAQVPETAAERRRREDVLQGVVDSPRTSMSMARPETAAEQRRRVAAAATAAQKGPATAGAAGSSSVGETPAEWRRRVAALGHSEDADADADEEEEEEVRGRATGVPTLQTQESTASGRSRGIRFAAEPVRGPK